MDNIKEYLDQYVQSIRPPAEIRPNLDINYSIENHSVYINEVRPRDYGNLADYRSYPNVKFTYVKSRNIWKIYWMRADLKWHAYTPAKEVNTIEDAIKVYDADEYGCFKG
ncbi:DUF3024 domain-containing protein [Lewinella sp. 4G2]|uniref:DUF3024 domain-containing protein n=1 Tax=Lewinella sp. 4G2 TaxID=1803372 RepID=UPI0007B4C541|nr:hypothetical protein A3850_011815 [Lewinella sp. 4G2]